MPLKTPRTTVKRLPKRASYDFDTVAAILDAGFLCYVGFVADGQPYVIPTGFGRDGKTLYFHGSSVSRTLKTLADGVPMCLTVTHLDGLVLACSGFHSSMNYRAVVVLGKARTIDDEEDYAMPVWAGVLPMKIKAGTPLPDERLPATIQPPKYMKKARA